ncbi:mitogen-activated protein kinase kinase kinase 18 [Oryza sativa Japonica Group]|uniref:Os02g0322400 protein n=1 Tax=Oryza sativa subsp. japonica TaxID=39947 RepID=A0A0P0VIC7_ORYSJ|nr:mitogen-activated protein kinase kinase kinase 18 [Oryza sativa Japonica Group]KAB8087054.1 hypothetical protein EE612_010849 [Oryza sativa]KAF2944478.1 hypothetical protein DAI22_02g145700 [Oryza sativa Japonica Group]BAS78390.1 Os02g0322400 [Oryza sativa Japonica Group]
MGAIGEWRRGPVIGRGATATVSIATDRRTGGVFAVKSVDVARAGALRREQGMLSALASPFVVPCVGSGVSAAVDGSGGACYDLFLEYAPGGSLADEIKRCGGRCEEPLIRSRVGDVLRGLAYVHAAGIAHCDVKGRNVLVGADGRAMLADFGCARWMAAEDCNAGGVTIRGTPMFLAPEAARGEAQGTAADIWALGCTVIEMATGGAPWPRFADPVAALHHVAHSVDVPESPAWFSAEGKDFLARCLIRDPAKRWTAEQLLEHPFVASAASDSTSKAVQIEQRVSPKSILDQCLWESTSTDSDATVALAPADRLRALSAGASVAPDWTWSMDDWIAVCGGRADDHDTTPSPQPDTTTSFFRGDEASSDLVFPGGGELAAAADGPRGHDDDDDDDDHGVSSSPCSWRRSNSAISGCNNRNNNRCCNFTQTKQWSIKLVKPSPRPSWQPI